MEKRLLLALVLSVGIMFAWQMLFMPKKKPVKPKADITTEQQASQKAEADAPAASGKALDDTRKAAGDAQAAIEADTGIEADTVTPPGTGTETDEQPLADTAKPVVAPEPKPVVEEIHTVSTTLYDGEFSSLDAAVKRWEFKDPRYSVEVKDPKTGETHREQIDLVSTRVKAPGHLPLTLRFPNLKGTTPPGEGWTYQKTANGFQYYFDSPQGVRFIKEFTFKPEDPYSFDLTVKVQNRSGKPIQESMELELSAYRAKEDIQGGGFSGPSTNNQVPKIYIDGSVEDEEGADELAKGWRMAGHISWAAIDEHYFMTAIIPLQKENVAVFARRGEDNILYLTMTLPEYKTDPGMETEHTFTVFMGPKELQVLNEVGYNLDASVNFWILGVLAKPMLSFLKWSNSILGNWGLAILLLTLVVKLIMFPLTHKSYVSMQRMKDLKPKMDRLKEKYKEDREEFNRQVMDLYKREKVNPLGGCLPMLLQMPVYIALYRALWGAVELYNAPFIPGWINDLSRPEPGTVKILPLILGIMMFAQQKLTPQAMDNEQQKMMMWMMPIMMVVFMWFLPAGLVLYIMASTFLGVAQQVAYNKWKIGSPTAPAAPQKGNKAKA